MKKLPVDHTDLEIPEIPPNAVLRPARHQPSANARIPRKKTMLDLDIDIIAWFKGEAERGGLNHTDHINKALRQYIVDLIGDKPVSLPRHKRQDLKAQKETKERPCF
jgi:uncharacterized protein (DUF4415 family)